MDDTAFPLICALESCRKPFIPHERTPTSQKFCEAKCRRRSRYNRTREQRIAYSTEWVRNNRDKHRQYGKRWRERVGREVQNEIARRNRARNPQAYRDAAKRHIKKYPERVAARGRAHRAANRDRYRQWRQAFHAANPEYNRLQIAKRRARKCGNPGSVGISVRDWRRLLLIYRRQCAYCGVRGELVVDHVVPLARGGRDAIGNVVPACRPCNQSKHAKLLAKWRFQTRRGV